MRCVSLGVSRAALDAALRVPAHTAAVKSNLAALDVPAPPAINAPHAISGKLGIGVKATVTRSGPQAGFCASSG